MKKRIGNFKKWCSRRLHEYWGCEAKKAQERLISYGIEKGDKMKFNIIDCIEFEIDWKAVAAIATCVLGYAIITVI